MALYPLQKAPFGLKWCRTWSTPYKKLGPNPLKQVGEAGQVGVVADDEF